MCASVGCWRHELLLHHHHWQRNWYRQVCADIINFFFHSIYYMDSVRTDVTKIVFSVKSGAFQFVVECSSVLLDAITMYRVNS